MTEAARKMYENVYGRNLLEETVAVMEEHGKTPDDVKWAGSHEFGYFDWSEFAEVAAATDYDSGHGAQKVAEDLLVVGDGWWMERGEYDGSEWWEFKEPPKRPTSHRRPEKFTAPEAMWDSLEDMHKPADAPQSPVRDET